MNKQLVSITTALAIATAGGLAFAQSDKNPNAAADGGVPKVEMNVGADAKNDGGLPGVEANVGADGDQKNINTANTANDTTTLGAGPATTDMSTDMNQPKADRN